MAPAGTLPLDEACLRQVTVCLPVARRASVKAEPIRPEEPTIATVLIWLESGEEDMVKVLEKVLVRLFLCVQAANVTVTRWERTLLKRGTESLWLW